MRIRLVIPGMPVPGEARSPRTFPRGDILCRHAADVRDILPAVGSHSVGPRSQAAARRTAPQGEVRAVPAPTDVGIGIAQDVHCLLDGDGGGDQRQAQLAGQRPKGLQLVEAGEGQQDLALVDSAQASDQGRVGAGKLQRAPGGAVEREIARAQRGGRDACRPAVRFLDAAGIKNGMTGRPPTWDH